MIIVIHQFIFANPKPGMNVEDFQNYWINVHAVNYASKIPQIKKYNVDRVKDIGFKVQFNGIAEIWLEDFEQELASLQTPEFIKGARADEPNWAAFWETVSLDTYDIVKKDYLNEESAINHKKLVLIFKRKDGIPLNVFRSYATDTNSHLLIDNNYIQKFVQSFAYEQSYAVGEPKFDCIYQLWFENMEKVKEFVNGDFYKNIFKCDINKFINMRYYFEFACEENWIIK